MADSEPTSERTPVDPLVLLVRQPMGFVESTSMVFSLSRDTGPLSLLTKGMKPLIMLGERLPSVLVNPVCYLY